MDRLELIQQAKRSAGEAIENAAPDCSWIDWDDLAERDVAAAIRKMAYGLAEGAMRALEIWL